MSDPWVGGAVAQELGLGEDLVTGEAVVLDLRPASFVTRALALALDLVVVVVLLVLASWLLTAAPGVLGEAGDNALALVVVLGVLIGVPVLIETFSRGRSLGKLAAGLRVVRDDGGPIRARQALIRGLLGVLELWWTFGSVALITSLLNRRGKRLGDLLAGTYVIRERSPQEAPDPIWMPPRLRPWAAITDLGRLPDRLAVAGKQYLTRVQQLDPATRQRLGPAIAGQFSAYVAPAPPTGTTPEEFIAAVLAERRERDYRRLRHEAETVAARRRRRGAAGPLSPLGRIGDQYR